MRIGTYCVCAAIAATMTGLAGIRALATTPPSGSGMTCPLWDGKESVAEYAKRANLPPTETLDLGGGVKLELVLVPAGKFLMGTPEPESLWVGRGIVIGGGAAAFMLLAMVVVGMIQRRSWRPQFSLAWLLAFIGGLSIVSYGGVRWWQTNRAWSRIGNKDEWPSHEVSLTKPFLMGKFEVTQEQYKKLMGDRQSWFNADRNPVDGVSWDDAQEFCKQASKVTERNVRLPTEAEWEYACRAGTETLFYTGDGDGDLDKAGWYYGNSDYGTHPAGQKAANAWGLYDMHGNVCEWCWDWYGNYAKGPTASPQGARLGDHRVLRGGTWFNGPKSCRSASRSSAVPDFSHHDIGFRVLVVACNNR
jgi:formylglycine-generating enzyme required for sulfatase activity